MKIRAGEAERAEGHAKASLRWFDAVGSGAPAGHKAVAEAVEVVARLVVIERARSGLADQPGLMQRADTGRTARLAGVLYH